MNEDYVALKLLKMKFEEEKLKLNQPAEWLFIAHESLLN